MLPSSLPNKIVVTGSRYDKLPGQLQQKIIWAFGQDILGDLVDPVSFPFAQVNNRKITLSFRSATEADEQALQSLLPEGEITDISQLPSTIPSYLVNVVPELAVNGQVVKTGSAIRIRPKRFQCPYCYKGPTTTQRYECYDPKSPHTKAYENWILRELVNGTLSDVGLKRSLSVDCIEGFLNRHIQRQVD